jgi:NitT/TauT family transport system permease protein
MPVDALAPVDVAARPGALDEELAGLDALELAVEPGAGRVARAWSAAWPKLAAVGIALFLWQCVVWSHWKPEYILPGPAKVLQTFADSVRDGTFVRSFGVTMRRAATGFAMAIVIGVVVGSLVARIRLLRVAFGSLITGLQTMPSVAWFPLAIMLFQLSEKAILFVIIIGAAPSIANGLISGTDQIPPILLRAGRVLGAKGFSAFRYVVLPASLPSFVSGLKQGWAFSWRSLMAGELLVVGIGKKPGIGAQLEINRQLADYAGVLAVMVLILLIGIAVDALCFGVVERTIRRRRGLLQT